MVAHRIFMPALALAASAIAFSAPASAQLLGGSGGLGGGLGGTIGGTLGNPTGPVWKGEIQGPGLGMAVDVFSEDGQPVRGKKGELVCTKPFVSMPVTGANVARRLAGGSECMEPALLSSMID